METGAITQYVDVAQLVLYAFWAFFAGLIYYLVRENHREGYPMDSDSGGTITGWPVPQPKTFLTSHGEVVVPKAEPTAALQAEPVHGWAGAPLLPTGDPLLAGVGPGAYTRRADRPDESFDGSHKLQPLRLATGYGVVAGDIDPRGLTVYGADGEPGGQVVDLWVDEAETLFRYLEVQAASNGRRVLVPWNFAKFRRTRQDGESVTVDALLGSQFGNVPATAPPDQGTLDEEDRIMGYFGAGTLYAEPGRAEPLV